MDLHQVKYVRMTKWKHSAETCSSSNFSLVKDSITWNVSWCYSFFSLGPWRWCCFSAGALPPGVTVCYTRKQEFLCSQHRSAHVPIPTQKVLTPWVCGEQLCLETLSVPKSGRLHSLAAAVLASYVSHNTFITCIFNFSDQCPVCRLCHYEHIGYIGKIVSLNVSIIHSIHKNAILTFK